MHSGSGAQRYIVRTFSFAPAYTRTGMDVEGIYRKSGGNGQIQIIKEGFERSNDFDISDPDLDIHAVTSLLKQYFRRLPTPLITYEIYDKLLDAIQIHDEEKRIASMRIAIQGLPPCHRDCLEFLVFHLARVVEKEKDNLVSRHPPTLLQRIS